MMDAVMRAESILRRVKDARLYLELKGGVAEPDLTRDLQWCAEQLLAALASRVPEPPQAQEARTQAISHFLSVAADYDLRDQIHGLERDFADAVERLAALASTPAAAPTEAKG